MRLTPVSLGGRLILGAAVFITVALIIAGGAIGVVLHRFVQGQIDQRLDGQIDTVALALEWSPDGRIGLVRNVDGPPFDRLFSGWYWQVFGVEPALRSRSLAGAYLGLPAIRQDGPRDWEGRPKPAEGVGPRGEPLHLRAQRRSVGLRSVMVVASAPHEAINGPLREALTPLMSSLGVLGVALILAMLLQVRLGLRPLTKLRMSLSKVRAGWLKHIPSDQPREVHPLVVELNSLIDENSESLARARRHVANLAHGLKTPLATLAVGLEEPGRDPNGQLHSLVDLMDRRIRHHLGRARAAAVGGPARAQTLLAPRVADLAAVLPKIYAGKPIAFETDLPRDLAVACEAQDLDEMLGNLLDNAFKWASGRVCFAARSNGGHVLISIDDDGAGLPQDKIPDVLRPGRRLDESAPGYGFGLPITRELAELYGGELGLNSSALGGLKVLLTLPRAA